MATITPVDVGAAPNDGNGDPLRTAFIKINANDTNLNAETTANTTQVGTNATAISDHISDPTAAHAATAVSFAPDGDVAATEVQAAIVEVRDDAATATATKSDITRTINAQTGTAFTPALTDSGDVVTMDNAAANVLTVPTNAAVAYAVGTQLDISQLGAGVTSVTGDTGVTINGVSAGTGALAARYGSVTLLKLATNTWLLTGNHDAVA